MTPLPAPEDLDEPEEILLRHVRQGLPRGPNAERDREELLDQLRDVAEPRRIRASGSERRVRSR